MKLTGKAGTQIIYKSDLFNNTYETLSSVIFHLIQSGIKLEIDYEIIQKFVSSNPAPSKKMEHNISLKEKKFLASYIDNILTDMDQENLS